MSDKFFFKGRKDARQTTLTYGYERNASRIAGSKKYPLKLVVTNEARKQEVKALVADADLYADIITRKSSNNISTKMAQLIVRALLIAADRVH